MNNLQILVENIRRSIAFPETVLPEQMQDYARSYTESCAELNRRTLQCIQQIRTGNVAEGVRLAELKPNLTELYLSLDIPEREEWEEIVSTLGFDIPAPLPGEMFKEINDAYLKVSTLEPLMRLHRLHALNGSSIAERLMFLRAIAKKDRENISWVEDQEKFEKARIKELETKIRKAIEANNPQQIQRYYSEVVAQDWIVPPPASFRLRLVGAVLQNHADSLLEKFSIYDYDAAVPIYDTMRQILSKERMTMPPTISQLIRPAVQWLSATQDQERLNSEFRFTVTELQNALENEEAAPELERLYYTLGTIATQAGASIPVELEELYRTELKRQYTAGTWRNRMGILVIIAVSLLVAIFLTWMLYLGEYNRQVNGAIDSATEILEKDRVDGMPDEIKNINNNWWGIAKDSRMIPFIQRLQKRIDEHKTIIEDISKQRSEIDSKLDEKLNLFALKNEIKNSINQMEKRYEELSPTSQETSRVKKDIDTLKQKYSNLLEEEQRKIDKQYEESLTPISGKIKDLEDKTKNDLPSEEVLRSLNELNRIDQNEFKPLQEQLGGHVTGKYKEEGNKVAGRITSLRDKLERTLKLKEAVKDLITFASNKDWTQYRTQLQKISYFPSDYPNVKEVNDVLKDWDTVAGFADSFEDLATSYSKNTGNFQALKRDSKSLWDKYNKVARQVSPEELSKIFRLNSGDLSDLTKMIDYSPGSFGTVETYLKRNEFTRNLYPWIEGDKWYYLTTPLERRTTDYKYVTSPIGAENDLTIARNKLNEDKFSSVTPFSFATSAQKEIDGIEGNVRVEIVMQKITSHLFRKDKAEEPGIDPIMQCIILELLIEDMSKLDPFFARNFEGLHRFIRDSYPQGTSWEKINWLDVRPDLSILERRRDVARTTIEKVRPIILEQINKTREEREAFVKRVENFKPRFERVGVLIRENEMLVLCPDFSGAESGDLFIFRRSNNTIVPSKIGAISSGKIDWSSNISRESQFTPVFLVQ